MRQPRQGPLGLQAGDDQTVAPGTYDPDKDIWELYYLPDDFSQARNVAADNPDKLKELQEPFWREAERNRVLPLLAPFSVWLGDLPPLPTITRFTFAGDVQNVQTTMIPRIYGRSDAIEAEVHVPDGGADGVLVALADFIGGLRCGSTRGLGSGGRVTLWANDRQIGEGTMPQTVSLIYTTYAGMDIGRDNGGVVDLAYEEKAPYPYSGTVKQVVFDLRPAAHDDQHALHAATQQAGVAHAVSG
jgi:hypothetical protein